MYVDGLCFSGYFCLRKQFVRDGRGGKVISDNSLTITPMKQLEKFLLLDLKEFENWLTGLVVKRKIKIIQNHHTWIPDYTLFNKSVDTHFPLLKSMEQSHCERGFAQIAQNITTFPDGLIAICRPFDVIPAGIKGANA